MVPSGWDAERLNAMRDTLIDFARDHLDAEGNLGDVHDVFRERNFSYASMDAFFAAYGAALLLRTNSKNLQLAHAMLDLMKLASDK